jgi:hypothetical protein
MDTKQATAEGKRNARNAAGTIMPPENAKSTYTNVPTAEMTTQHGTLTVHGGERRVSASMI